MATRDSLTEESFESRSRVGREAAYRSAYHGTVVAGAIFGAGMGVYAGWELLLSDGESTLIQTTAFISLGLTFALVFFCVTFVLGVIPIAVIYVFDLSIGATIPPRLIAVISGGFAGYLASCGTLDWLSIKSIFFTVGMISLGSVCTGVSSHFALRGIDSSRVVRVRFGIRELMVVTTWAAVGFCFMGMFGNPLDNAIGFAFYLILQALLVVADDARSAVVRSGV